MMKLTTFRRPFFLLIAICTIISTTSCNNNDDDNDTASGSSYKITVSLNNVNIMDDYVSIVVVGSDISGNNTFPMWRINTQDLAATQSLSLGDNDFTGDTKTYIIETIHPIDILNIGVQIINYGENLTGTLRVERNGSDEINEVINLIGDNTDFTENYSFNN